MEQSNLSPLASLDSLEGTISESEKPLMSGYLNMNQQSGMYKMNGIEGNHFLWPNFIANPSRIVEKTPFRRAVSLFSVTAVQTVQRQPNALERPGNVKTWWRER